MNIGQVLEIHLSLAAKALGFNIATPVFDGADENDIMDTLDLANDYVNLSWEEFEAKHKEELLPEVLQYLSDNREHRNCGRAFRYPETARSACATDVPASISTARLPSDTCTT